jgi:hypothetical protein
MCGLAGVNLCVLACDWSTRDRTVRLKERIYTLCTVKLQASASVGRDEELSVRPRRGEPGRHISGSQVHVSRLTWMKSLYPSPNIMGWARQRRYEKSLQNFGRKTWTDELHKLRIDISRWLLVTR